MPKIIDTPAVETVSPFAADIESLIAAGDGKSLTYDKADGITDEKSADSLKLKFQRAANAVGRTARAKVEKAENGDFSVTFTLRPKQKTRTTKPADDESGPAADERDPEVAAAQDAIANAEPTAKAPAAPKDSAKPRPVR